MTSALTSVVAVAGRAGSPIDWVRPLGTLWLPLHLRTHTRLHAQGMRVGHLSLSRLLTSNLIFTSAGEGAAARGHTARRRALTPARPLQASLC